MPLTDFVRYLNAQLPFSHVQSASPFFVEDGRVLVDYAYMRLESEFFPIIETAGGGIRGHGARLLATGKYSEQRVGTQAVFVLPCSDEELVFIDRLVRTLHTLNYLTYLDRKSRGLLLLKVHPRHVASVATDHGLAFEEILRACGLLPKEIILELEVHEGIDTAHLLRAISSYKARGYGIALTGSGNHIPELDLIREAQPMIVSLDQRAMTSAGSVSLLVEALHRWQITTMIRSDDPSLADKSIREHGFSLRTLSAEQPLLRASSWEKKSFADCL